MKVFSGSLSKSIYTVLILSPLEYQSPPVQMRTATQGFEGALQKYQNDDLLILLCTSDLFLQQKTNNILSFKNVKGKESFSTRKHFLAFSEYLKES